MRDLTHIVIHHSATPSGRTLFSADRVWPDPAAVTPVREIDRWHAERGFKRAPEWRARTNPDLAAIGYHFVLYMNGACASGRDMDEVGAHCRGHNATTLGVCLVGTGKFTHAQWRTLTLLVGDLQKRFPGIEVLGHRDLAATECPGFDVRGWYAAGMGELAGHVYPEPPLVAELPSIEGAAKALEKGVS